MRWTIVLLLTAFIGTCALAGDVEQRTIQLFTASHKLDSAKAACLKDLSAKPDYAAAVKATAEAQAKLEAARDGTDTSAKIEASHQYNVVRKHQTDLEAKAILRSVEVQKASDAVEQAKAELGAAQRAEKMNSAEVAKHQAEVQDLQGRVSVEYDRFKDRTRVSSPSVDFKPKGDAPRYHSLRVYYAFKGRDRNEKVDEISLNVDSIGRDWEYLKIHESLKMILICDGERITIPIDDFDSEVGDYTHGNCWESMYFKVSAAEVRKIVSSVSIDGQIGSTEFYFNEEMRMAMKAVTINAGIVEK